MTKLRSSHEELPLFSFRTGIPTGGRTLSPTTEALQITGMLMTRGSEALLHRQGILNPIAIKMNFLRMTVMFSINHGAVTAVLNLCVVVLGSVGSYMNGALYVAYAATALCGSGAIVGLLGCRGALIVGTAVYCV
jgi:hypothetical protein